MWFRCIRHLWVCKLWALRVGRSLSLHPSLTSPHRVAYWHFTHPALFRLPFFLHSLFDLTRATGMDVAEVLGNNASQAMGFQLFAPVDASLSTGGSPVGTVRTTAVCSLFVYVAVSELC